MIFQIAEAVLRSAGTSEARSTPFFNGIERASVHDPQAVLQEEVRPQDFAAAEGNCGWRFSKTAATASVRSSDGRNAEFQAAT